MARRLEGKPFHLLATHCQNGSKDDVVRYVKSKGLDADAPNFTVSSFGGHPKVKGNGHVPYYMVFDHHGDLAHQHMCGDYHGGDGLKMIEWVDKLLAKVPAIYLGKAPFTAVPALARRIGKRKRLPASIREIDKLLAEDPDDTTRGELERLKSAVDDYRKRMLKKTDDLLGSEPTAVIPALKSLQKDFKGTAGATAIDEKLAEMHASATLKKSVAIFKTYRRTMKRLEKAKGPSEKRRRGVVKKLAKLLAGNESLPIAKKIRAAIDSLR